MTVYEWLQRARRLDAQIECKLAERQRLMDLATNITSSYNGMPHGKGTVPQKIQDIAVKLVELSNDIDSLVDDYVDTKNEIVATLEKLPPNEYKVLHKHYIQNLTWEQVAEDLGYSTVHIWRIKKKACIHLKNIITATP